MSLKIIRAGLLDTVQDGGRYGFRHQGIGPGGVMDWWSAGLANALLGQELPAPVIELHFPAAQVLFEKQALICITGGDFGPQLDGIEIAINQPVAVNQNTVLTFTENRNGARCYLAVWGQCKVKPWLHSYSTHLKAAAGGCNGRQLQKDDTIGWNETSFFTEKKWLSLPWKYRNANINARAIDVLPGPEWNWLETESKNSFLHESFQLTRAADRMGYRLAGVPLHPVHQEQLVSSAVDFGTVQLLPNGQIIVLMADHQTTGGYPRIAHVTKADLPVLAQMPVGEKMSFRLTTLAAAEQKWMALQKTLLQLQNTCKLKQENWMYAHRY